MASRRSRSEESRLGTRTHRKLVGPVAGLVLAMLVAPSLAQESEVLFEAATVEIGNQDRMTHSIDFDQDGYLDAIGYWWYEEDDTELDLYRIAAFRFTPTHGFQKVWEELLEGEVGTPSNLIDRLPLDVGDVYGAPGFTVATRRDGIRTYRFDGGGEPELIGVGGLSNVTDIRRADYNGDGVEDVAALADDLLRIWFAVGPDENPRTGNFNVTPRLHLTLAELDGDDDPDLILWDDDAFDLYEIQNEIATYVGTYPTLGGNVRVTAGDIDGDGDDDLVSFQVPINQENPLFQVFRRTGPMTFVPEPVQVGGPAETLIDVDQDGDLDGLCCGGGGGGGGYPPEPRFNTRSSTFFVSRNDGAGNFAPAYRIPGLGAIRLAAAADIDLDGDVDLVGGRAVYYGNEGNYEVPRTITGNYLVTPQGLADADGDGDLDFKFGLQDEEHFVNDASGFFDIASTVYPQAPAGTEFAAHGFPGDFTGNGAADLVVEHKVTNGAFLGMRLLANTGGGGLIDAGPAGEAGIRFVQAGGSVGSIYVRFHALDVDSDGDRDFCALLPGDATTGQVWLNDGAGYFEPGDTFDGFAWFAGELTGDGIVDLLTHDAVNDKLYIVRGTGDGQFEPAGFISDLGRFTYPEAGDIDDDGDIDIATITEEGGIAFHINDGSGHFVRFMTLRSFDEDVGSLPRAFVRDVNGDGRADIVANDSDDGEGCSTVWLHEGPGLVHGEPRDYVMRATAMADFDGDGDLDVAHRSHLFIRKTILLNRTLEGPAAGSCRQFGAGLAGSGGMVPVLGTTGPLRRGNPIEHRLRNGLGNARAVLIWGTEPAELMKKGGTVYTIPRGKERVRLSGEPGVPGVGSYTFGYPDVAAGWVGRTFYLQFGVLDPAASHGVAISNAEVITYGVD